MNNSTNVKKRKHCITTEEKYANAMSKFKYKCTHCGTNTCISPKDTKKICKVCGNYVFKSKKDEVKFKVISRLNKINSH